MLKLYNSLGHSKQVFTPLKESEVKMYVCGPTLYNDIHIGNARPIVIFDVLFRILQKLYPSVIYVRNITDVDDKIIARAKELNISIEELIENTSKSFYSDIFHLNVLTPSFEPKATDFIEQMQQMITQLLHKGYAYSVDNHIFFDVKKFSEYGKLSGIVQEENQDGVRIENIKAKKHSADFVLWKPSKINEVGWDSLWGFGRPGWHIECSAMAKHYLGDFIDIHGGGKDLLFPHHENERAQSMCCNDGGEFAKYWIHNGFINVEGEKMSKSLGNFITLKSLLSKYDGIVIRLCLLGTHYRQNLNFSQELLDNSYKTLDKFFNILQGCKNIQAKEIEDSEFNTFLLDDLNTAGGLSILHKNFSSLKEATNVADKKQYKSKILYCGNLLGLDFTNVDDWFAKKNVNNKNTINIDENEIADLIEQRQVAKANKDYNKADEIRSILESKGIELQDSKDGVKWKIKI